MTDKPADNIIAGLEEALAHRRGEIPLWVTVIPDRLPGETDEQHRARWKRKYRYADGR